MRSGLGYTIKSIGHNIVGSFFMTDFEVKILHQQGPPHQLLVGILVQEDEWVVVTVHCDRKGTGTNVHLEILSCQLQGESEVGEQLTF